MTAISVLMSVYNAEKYINETIKSVLNQSFTDFEFIIIDDGSTDGTKTIINQFKDDRIRYFYFSNSGLAAALNKGLQRATGKYIARIDADDICYPNRLEVQYNFMEANPEYVLCGSSIDVIDEHGNFIYKFTLPTKDSEIRKQMQYENGITHPSSFYRREEALKVGGYYEPIRQYFEDYMFFYQLIKCGKVMNISESLIKYRLTPGSISSRSRNKKYERIVSEVVRRGYITENERAYILNFRGKKAKPRIKYSNHYLSLSRLVLSHQKDNQSALKYLTRAIMINPLNYNTIPTLGYLLLTKVKNIIKK